jgi:tRNA A37 threonylcarbamoyladenosine synthetase subunit TsaC/SUA5/YrdC
MSARSTIHDLIEIFGSAIAAASAAKHGRQPNARDLRALGIDPAHFRQIRQS